MADLTVHVGGFARCEETMHLLFRLTFLPYALLFGGLSFAQAESPMPEPIAPAVVGRPLDQIRPVRPAPQKATVARPLRPRPMAMAPAPHPAKPVTRAKPVAPAHAARQPKAPAQVARQPAAAVQVARQPAPAAQVLGAAAADAAVAGARPAKQAVDDRFDSRMRFEEVGKGTHFARKPLAPGAYFGDRHRTAVRKYYEEHPASGAAASWRIGEPVPRGARLKALPGSVVASLPNLPPGHRYVELDGDVVMIASGSKMVVDGISRGAR